MSFNLIPNYKKVRLSQTPFIGFDVENDGSIGGASSFTHGHVFGFYERRKRVTVTKQNKKAGIKREQGDEYELIPVDEHFIDRQKMIDYINSINKTSGRKAPFILIGFNTAYDYPFIQDICDDDKKLFSGTSFISGKTKGGVKIMDIKNHWKYGSLEDAMISFDMEKKYGIRKLSLSESEIEDRNRMDAMATYYLAVEYREMYNKQGVDLRLTAPSNALDMFVNKFMPENFSVHRTDEQLNVFERKAYLGGRCEMFKRGITNTASYDVHSMYASVMRDCDYPDPMSALHYMEGAPNHWKERYYDPKHLLGIYSVTVEAPDMNIPVLGKRTTIEGDKYEKLIFPVGVFSGVWTSEELRYAESVGYKILNCDEFIVYKKKLLLFKEYVDFWWNERNKAKARKDTPMSDFCKVMVNSLYGKFGQQNREGGFCGKESDFDWGKIDMATFDKTPIRYVTDEGVPMLLIPPDNVPEDAHHTIPCLAVFVASYARLKLCKGIHRAEAGGLLPVYCDTDSIKLTMPDGKMPDREQADNIIGAHESELGKFGYEYSKIQYFQSQKVYTTVNKDGKPDSIEFTAKGMNKKGVTLTISGDLNDPDSVKWHGEFQSPVKEKSSIIQKLPVDLWKDRTKDLLGHGNKRQWSGLYSRPHRLNEPVIL